MAREYFCAYHSYLQAMARLTDEEAGRLFRALLRYSETGLTPDQPGNEAYAFDFIAAQIDRDAKKYEGYAAAQAEKAKKRWDAAASRGISGNADDAKEKKKKKEKKNTPHTPQRGAEFEEFWSKYPKKVGKEPARKAFERALEKTTLGSLLTAVERQKCSSQWSRDGGQYIPNPATWLNQERWEDKLPEVPGPPAGEEDDGYGPTLL